MKRRSRDSIAITLVEISIVLAVLGMLLLIAIPNFTAARQRVYRDMCINSLRRIELAKEQWAIENDKDTGDTPVAADLDIYIKDGTASLVCPLDVGGSSATSYDINAVGTDAACKISPGDHHL